MIKVDIKKSVIQLVRKLGYEIVPVSRVMPRDIAGCLKYLLSILNITCVFDVGANIGQYRDFLRTEVGYDDLIVSFEPSKKAANVLREKCRSDAHWLVYECALGKQSGVRPFNVMKADTLSSFLAPDNSVTGLFAPYNVVDHTEDVQVKTLDTVLEELRMQRDIGDGWLLKMDTQGYDLEVLEGADRSLSEISAVQTELSCLRLYKEMPDYVKVLDALCKRGFQLSGLFPVSQDTSFRIIEADCLMINGERFRSDNARLMWTNAI